MPYTPIENYGIIGDMRTVALISIEGSIDWYCYPNFDSPSIFGAILDDKKGGYFKISPQKDDVRNKQFYFPDTNVLITRFLSADGVAEITDFMPLDNDIETIHSRRQLVRQVRMVRGSMPLRAVCRPALDYAMTRHETELCGAGAVFHGPRLTLGLATPLKLEVQDQQVVANFTLNEGENASFILEELDGERKLDCPLESSVEQGFRETVAYWRRWIEKSNYRGRWREMVNRSALALKLMTFEPTGAIVAAPTCSLPEEIGGSRNWDYRYTWIRDASFTLYGLMRIGITTEAHRFIDWLKARIHEPNPDNSLQIMYSISGEHKLTERTLDHLEGYRGSGPVRVGNGAYDQLQLDIYGELMDSIYLYNKYGMPIDYDLWNYLRRMIHYVVENWNQPDEGIWEVRGGRRHFVYSKLMCWVALDRAVRLADKRSFPCDRDLWLKTRDEIYEEIMAKGWNSERKAFVQSYGSDVLDASTLMMPLVFFVSPTDPRMLSTIDAILKELVSDSLVYRYNFDPKLDGLAGGEGTFSICTFWLVEALTRARRVEHARLIFEKMLGHANHLGLYAEEIGPHGEALGNFPQAFTHLALISAAYNLDRTLGDAG